MIELVDVLDENGNKTGEVIDRNEVDTCKSYYLGIHVYIYNSKNEFLIQKRSYNKKINPGVWDLNMGHTIAGETSKESAIREVYEEIGITIKPTEIKFIGRYKWSEFHHFVDVWVVNRDTDVNETRLSDKEVVDIMYVSKSELIELLSTSKYRKPRPKEYLEIVLKFLETID